MTSIDELHALFRRLGRPMPDAYAHLLAHPDEVPQWFRSDVYTDPVQILQLNHDLRTTGFGGEPWPDDCIALGVDPSASVYFIDSSDARLPVFLANYELSGSGSVRECSEPRGDSFDEWLARLRASNDRLEDDTPYAVFAAGFLEFERLRDHPTADSLEALFVARQRPYCALSQQQQARITAPLFDSFFVSLPPHVRFDLIGLASELAMRQDEPCAFRASLELLAQISRDANTSEMHPALDRVWPDLWERVARLALQSSSAWSDLERRHHRRA